MQRRRETRSGSFDGQQGTNSISGVANFGGGLDTSKSKKFNLFGKKRGGKSK